jgi:hypothetical protein
MDEVMFLQGTVEEKIGTLRLGGELANTAKTKAETSLLADQEALVAAQVLTEAENTAKVTAETSLINDQEALVVKQALTEVAKTTDIEADTTIKGKQGSLIDNQAATELKNALKLVAETSLINDQEALVVKQALDVQADTALKTSQKTQLDAQTAIEATAEKDFYDGVVDGTQETYRDYAAEMRIMGVQESTFQQTPAYKKVELLKDAAKLRIVTATETGTDATELLEVNKVMRFIGEPPVTALNDNSLASETVRLLRDTDTELQGRGWWFNTEEDVELTPSGSGHIIINNTMLSVEAYDYDTRMELGGYLYDLNKKSANNWTSPIKAKVIYKRTLSYTPQKYREYLSVRVAILLTELYPQSGVDIQRLPKMELELRAYFKDREFDDANYSVFDNYDVATRIGVNRNYDI